MAQNTNIAFENALNDKEKAQNLLESISLIVGLLNRPKMAFHKQLDEILMIILDYLGVEQGSIMLVEKKKELIVATATRQNLIGMRQSFDDDSVSSWVAKNQSPIFIPDIRKEKRFHIRDSQTYKKKALLSVPIVHAGKLLGIINVTDKIGEKDLLQDDISYLLDFSSVILSSLVQRQLQEELRRQKNTLRKRNRELRHQERLREELTRMLIHDLKAPLSEVVANLDILSYSISDENREFLEAAQMGCDRTVRMVTNLVTINKIEDGKLTLSKEETAAQSVINEAASAIKGLAKIKNVTISCEMPEDNIGIFIDRILILRVLQNLLTNALGYTDPGTAITVGCQTTKKQSQLEFFVKDEGPGIPLDKQSELFDKYSRFSDKNDALVGTGLGLYFCKIAVELHRGKIRVESQPGQGSTFYFTLQV